MINHVFNITEEQLVWLKRKALEAGQSTISAALRRVLFEAMERDGTDTTIARDALIKRITEN